MSLIDVTNLTFAYDGSYDNIFENVSFQLDTDWKLGFVGRNGRGKTTFLMLLLGRYDFAGTISSSVNFEYFPYAVDDKTRTTNEVISGICHDCEEWELIRELNLLHLSEDVLSRAFFTLSSGEQTKVLLAAMFLCKNSFLLIDEPTNHLDRAARVLVSRYLSTKQGFILVSHDRDFLDKSIDHIISINKTNIEIQKGNFSSWWANKTARDYFELAQNERLKKEIGRLNTAAKRSSDWSEQVEKTKYATRDSGLRPDRGFIGHKSAKMMKRAKAIDARREFAAVEKSKLLHNIEDNAPLKLSPLPYHKGRLVEFTNIGISYGDKEVCNGVSFTVEQGDRIALCGRNGCGKSSILKLIIGGNFAYSGSVNIGSQLKISYVSQDTSHLSGGLSKYAENLGIEESLFKTILRKLDFQRVQFEKDIADFSGGQKKKVLLAGSLCERAHLYVWDEPLNFIDVFSRMQIETLLLECGATVLFVEHDTNFCKNVATKIVEI